ncbi:MAG TPA: PKD domain-containing protein, partial [Acidobacteriaceae bacterium]|nr:PKD domain-containing protein [Acidobacteriaceae bacterium]
MWPFPGPFSFFAAPPLADPDPSFDFFTLAVPQAGAARIAFASNRDGRMQIYTMNADGTNQTRLTGSGGNDDAPRFSPSGAKILFQSDRDDPANASNDIYVMNADGTNQTRLTTAAGDNSSPAWSPDGSKVLFQSLRDGQYYQLYAMNADGSGPVNLSNSTGSDRQPSWSPNGAKITFASERDHAGYASIYVMNANGTNQTRLTFGGEGVTDEQPVWSRDGSRIAFVSTRDGDKEIYVMNADGTNQTRLTSDPGNDDSPSWSPDGTKLVFRSDRLRDCCDPASQVWVMNADGSGLVNLSASQYGDYSASWASGGSNQPPVADAGGSYSGITGQSTAFSGSGSFDPDGSIASYSWSFGDGGSASGAAPTHAYASPGTYTLTLTVTDNLGAQGSATATVNVSSSSSDQFVQNFLQWGLARQPGGQEGSYWGDILRAAYPQGQGSMLLAMREFGMTVFESAEYAARSRSDHEYVYDLYKTYLIRDPDPQGWAWWESRVPEMGREQLRQAFDESIEFGNIVATLSASGPPSSAAASLATARVDPFNQPGDQIRARDCEWGVTLLSLPGRAGLDLGLGLSYSSLVWTRSGPYAYFDEDRGSPSPGFSLGFATIRGPFFDAQAAKSVYVLVTSSGRRVALRQVGASNTYEAADSSYLQLTEGGGGLLLRSTDGTQVSYSSSNSGWRATLIEDRNGNFISVGYDWRGDITSVTDTLGRLITFNYDANANLSTITQGWQAGGIQQTHTWASFGWGTATLQPAFSAVAVVGASAGEVIPVLSQVGLDDGSRYNFEYNASGQVKTVRRYSSDNVERLRTTYDYQTPADDCPRVMAERVWADGWTGINGVPAEVMTQFADAGAGSHTMTAPDGTVYKDTYGTGWQRGLVIQSEVTAEGRQQRLAVTQWTQDDMTVGYQANPRVTETNVYDVPEGAPSNHRRTTIDYGPYAQWGLPYLVTEYDADGATPLRQSYTDYNLAQAYLDRRIIGLVAASQVYDPTAGQWLAKITYAYDEAGSVSTQATNAVSHDQSFNSSFRTRGNLTAISRWNVAPVGGDTSVHTFRRSYDAAGSVVSAADPLGHGNTLGYADSFSDSNNTRGTFAYPTILTDEDGFSSSIQYNFDFGARTRVEGPPPAGQPHGLMQSFAYDVAARLQQVTTVNSGAYRRYAYGPNYVASWATVNNAADEAYTNTVFDGLGRVILAGSNHPGSSGGYKAQATQYDLMGRPAAQSNPVETDGSWSPSGEDAAGWLYTRQTYDWKGRPRVTTHTDGAQASAGYEGCGCAGGEVVTLTDEVGRQQKVYSDALGRQWKTEVLDWDGSIYSTTTSKYNALDQVTRTRRYLGVAPNPEPEQAGSGYETTALTYDGYGRLSGGKQPIEAGPTSYTYNADDTVATTTDARGVVTTFGYNNRHQTTHTEYSHVAGIPDVGPVDWGYDAAGNRLWMTDDTGRVDYEYDSLSRLRVETRHFAGLGGAYPINYDYTVSGQLRVVTAPSGASITYSYDQAGRASGVAAANFGGAGTLASQIEYRAWGAIKRLTYGNAVNLDLGYNARLQVTQQSLKAPGTPAPGQVNRVNDYTYYPDGRVSFISDGADHSYDRSYTYDHDGRLTEALTGYEARGEQTGALSPYRETFQYDALGNTTNRYTRNWTYTTGLKGQRLSNGQWASFGAAPYEDGRRAGVTYDAAGNITDDGNLYTYDAVGQKTQSRTPNSTSVVSQSYDGDGRVAKRVETQGNSLVSYQVHAAGLGGALVEVLDAGGARAVIGTAAIEDPELVRRAVERWGAERIAVGLDARGRTPAARGWTEASGTDLFD